MDRNIGYTSSEITQTGAVVTATEADLRANRGSRVLGLFMLFSGCIVLGGICLLSLVAGNYVAAFLVFAGIFLWAFCLRLSPLTQSEADYDLSFPDGTLSSLRLYYKGKQVLVSMRFDDSGLFLWGDNRNREGCLSYADGSPMSGTVKRKLINYLTQTLMRVKLISPAIRPDTQWMN